MEELLVKKVSFQKKPIPIPAEYRPSFMIAQIALILKHCCRGESASLLKLHLLSWALKSTKNRNKLLLYFQDQANADPPILCIEPTLNRALQITIAEGLCNYKNFGKYTLTQKGRYFSQIIDKDQDIFLEEKSFLRMVGKSTITDKSLKTLTDTWKIFNDKY